MTDRKELRTIRAIIVMDGKVLLLQRSKISKRNAGYWELPGGKIEGDLSDTENLKREITEEIGISKIEILQKVLQTTRPFEDGEKFDVISCDIYFAQIQTEKITLSLENSDYTWVEPQSPTPVDLQLTHETIKALEFLRS